MSASAAKTEDRRSKLDLCLIALFVAAILAPALDRWIRPDAAGGLEEIEMRAPAPFPSFGGSSGSLVSFPDRFAAYFDDSFGLRDVLLRWHSIEKVLVFGVPPSTRVIFGRDRWMFYTGDHSMNVFRGLDPFTESELEQWRKMLESRRDYLARCGIDYMYVIGPSKESIYPDYMPAAQNRLGPTRMDQLMSYLESRSDFRILDLRPALIAARANERLEGHLYFELGTHWNGPGAAVAACAMANELHARFPRIPSRRFSDVTFDLMRDSGDSEAQRMYIDDLVPQRHVSIAPIEGIRARVTSKTWDPGVVEIDDPSLPRALILHDSFGPSVEPILGELFSQSTWSNQIEFDVDLIERVKPDVVIEVFVERVLVHLKPPAGEVERLERFPSSMSFEIARDVRFRLDLTEGSPAFSALGNTCLELGRDDEGEFVCIDTVDSSDTLLLPEFAWPAGSPTLVEVDIAAPAPTLLTLFYLCDGETEYSRRCGVSVSLAQGRNRVHLEIPSNGAHGRLRMRPGVDAGHYLLRGLEVRAPDPRPTIGGSSTGDRKTARQPDTRGR